MNNIPSFFRLRAVLTVAIAAMAFCRSMPRADARRLDLGPCPVSVEWAKARLAERGGASVLSDQYRLVWQGGLVPADYAGYAPLALSRLVPLDQWCTPWSNPRRIPAGMDTAVFERWTGSVSFYTDATLSGIAAAGATTQRTGAHGGYAFGRIDGLAFNIMPGGPVTRLLWARNAGGTVRFLYRELYPTESVRACSNVAKGYGWLKWCLAYAPPRFTPPKRPCAPPPCEVWHGISLAEAKAKASAQASIDVTVNAGTAPVAVERAPERVSAGVMPEETSQQLASLDYFRWNSRWNGRTVVRQPQSPTPQPAYGTPPDDDGHGLPGSIDRSTGGWSGQR